MARDFFAKFTEVVSPPGAAPEAEDPAPGEPEPGLSPFLWITGVLAIVAILLLVFGG